MCCTIVTAVQVSRQARDTRHGRIPRDYWERVFFALPLIHAEGLGHLERANRAAELVEMRLNDGPEHLRPIREFGLEQARRHRDIVARFGRHPHRNETLRRSSTPEEVA